MCLSEELRPDGEECLTPESSPVRAVSKEYCEELEAAVWTLYNCQQRYTRKDTDVDAAPGGIATPGPKKPTYSGALSPIKPTSVMATASLWGFTLWPGFEGKYETPWSSIAWGALGVACFAAISLGQPAPAPRRQCTSPSLLFM